MSTNENSFEKSIIVFPNPVENDINIQLETGDYRVLIFNVKCKMVSNNKILGNESLNLETLTKGIYLLLIKDVESSKVYKDKFVKL